MGKNAGNLCKSWVKAYQVFLPNIDFRLLGIIHLVRTQNFLKNYYFLPPDTCTYQWVRNIRFLENFAYVLNERFLSQTYHKTRAFSY